MSFVDPFGLLRLTAGYNRLYADSKALHRLMGRCDTHCEFLSCTSTVDSDTGTATIRCVVPGVGKEDIRLVARESGVLSVTIHGKTEYQVEFDRHNFNYKLITAECKNGVLTVTIPPMSQAPETDFVVAVS